MIAIAWQRTFAAIGNPGQVDLESINFISYRRDCDGRYPKPRLDIVWRRAASPTLSVSVRR
jgi:hypothetical protein